MSDDLAQVRYNEYLRLLRNSRGWTQQQLASRIDYSISLIQKVELARKRAPRLMIEACDTLFDAKGTLTKMWMRDVAEDQKQQTWRPGPHPRPVSGPPPEPGGMSFPRYFRHLRQIRGMSLRGLGELAGLSATTLSLIERGAGSGRGNSIERCDDVLEANGMLLDLWERSDPTVRVGVVQSRFRELERRADRDQCTVFELIDDALCQYLDQS